MSHHLAQALSISRDAAAQGIGIGLLIALIAGGIFLVVFFLAALFSILGADIGCGGKILWFLVILCLPFLGSLLWFVAGRPRPRPYY
ncbi:PLD nuclease N-terminal domain-containing protein [Kutzneria kofuensis]|uniref:Fatty acid desaturase n=1 Tax=Kutzneria kofuensis TaxID=103725 RepID=A0A7W9NDI9_9PSEU|nr:PLD nuclease N-terminal domain-containing protein [Kutzneria kofuensis]MBB5889312.1 fatty acid desaturase [Kutzneria kofuensis]